MTKIASITFAAVLGLSSLALPAFLTGSPPVEPTPGVSEKIDSAPAEAVPSGSIDIQAAVQTTALRCFAVDLLEEAQPLDMGGSFPCA